MRYILCVLLLVAPLAHAEIGPHKLVRKSDGVVVGMGNSRFEGVANPNDFEVIPVTPADAAQLHQSMRATLAAEHAQRQMARQAAQRAAANRMRVKLGLTPQEWDDLKAALR